MELITGTKTPERKLIFIDEGELLDPETCDEKTTVIRFVDFRKRNEKAMENKEIDSGH